MCAVSKTKTVAMFLRVPAVTKGCHYLIGHVCIDLVGLGYPYILLQIAHFLENLKQNK